MSRAQRAGLALLATLLLAGALAACGKKGSPEPPPGEHNTYPRSYPATHDDHDKPAAE